MMHSFRSSYRRRKRREYSIQIAPLVDVLLVLLLVFIFVMPNAIFGIGVDLPDGVGSKVQDKQEKSPITIGYTSDDYIFVNESQTSKREVISYINKITNRDFDTTIFIKADRVAVYGNVVNIIGELNKAGYKKTVLVTGYDSKG